MRIVFVGASKLALHTVKLLLSRDHEVIVIEQDKEKIEAKASTLGCGIISGDGSKPAILQEADPKNSDYLFCVTASDQTNIIASLVGRSLGFNKVVTRIDDPEYEHICMELGLENTIIPSQTISRHLADMIQGETTLTLSALVKDDAALFSFVVKEEDAMPLIELPLPNDCRPMFLYRNERFILPDDDTDLKEGDELVLACHRKVLEELRKRWIHSTSGSKPNTN